MKAVVFRKDRGLVYEEVPDYTVAEDEVLVKTANTGFCGSDHSLVAGGHLADGYILGHEISAVIVEKGAAAERHLSRLPTACRRSATSSPPSRGSVHLGSP